MTFDRFEPGTDSASSPARRIFLVVPDDNSPLAELPKWLRVDRGGSITYRAVDSGADVAETFADGDIIYARISHVRQTGTDAAVRLVAYA